MKNKGILTLEGLFTLSSFKLFFGLVFFVACGFALFGPARTAQAADTGFKTTTTVAAVAGRGDGNGFETTYGTNTPKDTTTDNAAGLRDAGSGTGNTTDGCGTFNQAEDDAADFSSFTFNVPSGSAINGIEVGSQLVTGTASGTNLFCFALSWNGGTNWTTAQSSGDINNELAVTLGGPADTWGRAWTDTEFSNANFKLRVMMDPSAANTLNFDIDLLQLKVYYTPPISIFGICKQYNESTDCTDDANDRIRVAFGSTVQSQVDTVVDGSWSITGLTPPANGTIVTVWIDGMTSGTADVPDADEAVAIAQYDGSGDITGMKLFAEHLTLGNDDPTTIDGADFAYDNIASGDEDIFFNYDTVTPYTCEGAPTTAANGFVGLCVDYTNQSTQEELYTLANTQYSPGTNFRTHDLEIVSGASFVGGDIHEYITGSWRNPGSYSPNGSHIHFLSDSSEIITNGSGSFFNEIFFEGSGSWTLQDNLNVTYSLTTSKITITSGNLIAGSNTITVSGTTPFTNNATFTYGTSTLKFDSTNSLTVPTTNMSGTSGTNGYYNLVLGGSSGTQTYTFASGNVAVNNDLTMGQSGGGTTTVTAATNNPNIDVDGNVLINTSDTFTASASGTLTVGGNWTTTGTFTHSNGTVTFDATDTGNTISSASSFNNVTFNGSNGFWTPNNSALTIAGNLTMTNGTLDGSTGTPTNVSVTGNVQCGVTCGTINFTATNTFTQTVDGTPRSFGTNVAVATNWSFNNLTFTASSQSIIANSTGTGTITVDGTLTISSNTTLDAGNRTWILAAANTPFTKTGTFQYGTSTIRYTGNGTTGVLSLNGSSGNDGYYNLELIPSSSSAQVLNTGTIRVNNNLTVGSAGATASSNNTAINVTGTTLIDTGATLTPGTGALTLTGDVTVTGTLSGSANSNITAGGSLTGAGSVNLTGGTLLQSVAADKNFGTTAGSNNWTFNNLTFSCSVSSTITTQTGGSGTITIGGVLLVSKTGDSCTTTLNAGNRTWDLSNTNSTGPFELDQASGVLTAATSTFRYTGDADLGNVIVENATYNHVEFGGAVSESYILEGSTTVAGNLTINANGTLDADFLNQPLFVGGNWTNNGSFSAQQGTVTLNTTTTATITGATSFYNLDIPVSAAGKIVQFQAASGCPGSCSPTFTISNSFTAAGTSGVHTSIKSTSAGTKWAVSFGANQPAANFSNIDLQDSGCATSVFTADMTGTGNTNVNSSNDPSCWIFVAAMSISGSSSGLSNGTVVRFAINSTLNGQQTTINNNAWTLASVNGVNSTDIITVWADGVANGSESVAIAKYDGTSNIDGMVLAVNTLTIGSTSDSSQSLTVANLDLYDCTQDGDIMHQAGSSALAVEGASCAADPTDSNGTTNSYANETISILANYTLTIGDTGSLTTDNLTNAGTLTSGGNSTYTVSGNWANTGTFTPGTSTVTFNATDSGHTINNGASSSFNNVIFNGSNGSWSAASNKMTIAGDLTMTAGTLNNASGSVDIELNGVLSCGVTCGIISLNTGLFEQRVTTSKTNALGSSNATWGFNNLTFSNSGSDFAGITYSGSGTLNVTIAGVLSIGRAADVPITVLSVVGTWTLSGNGTPLVIQTVIDGQNQFRGANTAGGGTLVYGGTGTVNVSDAGGSGGYYANLNFGAGNYLLPNTTIRIRGGNLSAASGAAITPGSGTILFQNLVSAANETVTITDSNASPTNLGNVQLSTIGIGSITVNLTTAAKVTTLTIDSGQTFSLNGSNTLTLTGSGGITRNGTFTASTGTVIYTAAGGTISSAAMTGSNAFHNLTINGSSTFNAGAALEAKNDLVVSGGTLAMGANDLTVGNSSNSNSGNIKVASGQSLTQTSSNTTTVKSSSSGSNCIGGNAASCAAVAGTITFGSLNIGDASTSMTTTLGNGSTTPTITVGNALTITSSANLNGGAATMIIQGTGTPLTRNGTFTYATSTIRYTGNGATVRAMAGSSGTNGYYNLELKPSGASAQVIQNNTTQVNGNLIIGDSTNAGADNSNNFGALYVVGDVNIASNATLITCGCGEGFEVGGSWTNNGTFNRGSASGNVTFVGSSSGKTITSGGANGKFGGLRIQAGISGSGGGSWTLLDNTEVSSISINSGSNLSAGATTITLAGTTCCTPFIVAGGGTFTYGTSTVNYTGTAVGNNINIAALNGTVGTNGYFNLGLGTTADSTSQTYILSGNTTVNGQLTVSNASSTGTDTLAAASFTLTLAASATPLNIISGKGAFSAGTSTVAYISGSGVSSGLSTIAMTDGNSFNSLTISGSGTFTAGVALAASTGITVSSGTLNVGANAITTANLTVDGTFTGSSSSLVTASGDVVGAGTINGVQLEQRVSTNKNFGQTSGSNNWTFQTLTFSNSTGGTPLTVTSQTGGSGEVRIIQTLNIGKTADSSGATTTLDAGNKTWSIGISGAGQLSNCGPNEFVISSKGIFTANTSTVNFVCRNVGTTTENIPGATYYNLGAGTSSDSDSAVTFTLGGNVTVSNTLTIGNASSTAADVLTTSGSNHSLTIGTISITSKGALTANSSAISVSGNWTNSGTFTKGTSTVTFNAANGANITISGNMSGNSAFNNLTLQGNSGGGPAYTFGSGTVQTDGAFTLASNCQTATIRADTNNTAFDILGDMTLGACGFFTKAASAKMTFKKGASQTLTNNSTSDLGNVQVSANGTNTTLNLVAGESFAHNVTSLIIDANQSVSLADLAILDIIGSGAASSRPLQLGSGATFSQGTGTYVRYRGTANTEIEAMPYGELRLIPSSGSPTYTLGTANSQTFTVGTLRMTGSGTINASTYNPAINNGTGGTALVLDNTAAFVAGSTNMTLSGLTILSSSNTYTKGSGIVIFKNPSTIILSDATVSKQDLGNIKISAPVSGSTTLQLTTGAKATTITIDPAQIFDVNGQTLTLLGSGTGSSQPLYNNSGTVGGLSNSTVVYAGSGASDIPALSYHHLQLTGGGAYTPAAGTLGVAGNLAVTSGTLNLNTNDPTTSVTGDLTIGGTLSASNTASLTVRGYFTNNGTFTHNNGTVVIDPAASLSIIGGSSNTTFHNFTATTPDTTLQFQGGRTFGFAGLLTVTGQPGSLVTLQSDSSPTRWTINLSGTKSLNYVRVADSACSAGAMTNLGDHVFDAGNNEPGCWVFIIRGGGAGSTPAGGGAGGNGNAGGGGEGNSGGTSTATATANVSGGAVISVTVTNGGSGYSQIPAVCFSGGGGSNATATATLSGTSVASISVSQGGSNYSSAPTVIIASPPGGGSCGNAGGGGEGNSGGGGGGASP